MNKYVPYVFLISVLIACTSEEKKTESVIGNDPDNISTEVINDSTIASEHIDKSAFDLQQWQDSFAFTSKISCFNEDSISHFENIVWKDANAYKSYSAPIIGKLLKQIEDLEKLEAWHMDIHEGTDFLYSIQQKQSHVGITVIGGNDGWVTEIRYLSFNQNGRKMGDVVLASKGGDGGFYTRGRGCFVNDSTYVYEYEESEYDFEEKMDKIYESGTLTYCIHRTGKIDMEKSKNFGDVY